MRLSFSLAGKPRRIDMESQRTPTPAVVLFILSSFLITKTSTYTSPTNTPTPPTPPRPPLDPKQLASLQSLGLSTSSDPCAATQTLTHKIFVTCDDSTPFRHVIILNLFDCSPDLSDLPFTALRPLSTLSSISFLNCPVSVPKRGLPFPLSSSLLSFSAVDSLCRISAVWLSRLHNLTELTLISVSITAVEGPIAILSQMPRLLSLTISVCNLSGHLPHHNWHAINLVNLNFSGNNLNGFIPTSISVLGSLQTLDLSSNKLNGTLPDSIGDLLELRNASFARNSITGPIPISISALSSLTHLDLSSNELNGEVPAFLAEMKNLKYLNLENNSFHGVLPFNSSFMRKMEVFKVGGNKELCYNRTLVAANLHLGISPCDRFGLPVSAPPPERSVNSDATENSDDVGDEDGRGIKRGGGVGQRGSSRLVLGVAIGLSCLVFLVVFLVCVSKVCRCNGQK